MKQLNRILLGIALVALGVILALNLFGITDVEIFFDGWWTLFLILPAFVGILTEREKTWNLILLLFGILLLLNAQDILDFDAVWKLVLIACLILFGLRMVCKGMFEKRSSKKKAPDIADSVNRVSAVFSAHEVDYTGKDFEGVEMNAVFGGIDCDLRGAIITKDIVIKANAVFGGVDIFLPENVNVQISSVSVFGGMESQRRSESIEGAVTVFVEGNCIFGGVDVH